MTATPQDPLTRTLLHTREIICKGYQRSDGLLDIEGRLLDLTNEPTDLPFHQVPGGGAIHDMHLVMTLDTDMVIQNITATTAVGASQFCAGAAPVYSRLQGLKITKGFKQQMKTIVGGTSGCTHLTELLERRDLPELIRHLLQLEAIEHKRVGLSESALQALLAYSWPGNIRQLQQTLRLAAALAEDEGMIGLQHLPDEILDGCVSEFKQPLVSGEVRLMARDTLQASEQRIIRAAVDACGGNLSAAARNLGIARATLYRKLKLIEEGAETMAAPMPRNGLDIVE